MVKSPIPSEHDEQASFVAEIRVRYASRSDFLPELFFSVPNGLQAGGRNRFALIAKFKAEGLNPGVFDIHYLQPRGNHPYLCMEFKRRDRRNEKGGGLSPEQYLYYQAAKLVGAAAFVCYTADEAVEKFNEYMGKEQ